MVEWSVLDAQWFGLAQRRKRVFVVADLGDWWNRPPVLLERASMLGNPPSREAPRESLTHPVAQSLGASGRGYSRAGETRGQDSVVAMPVGGTPLKGGWRGDLDQETYVSMALNAHPGGSRYDGESETFVVPPLRATDRTAAADGNWTEGDGLVVPQLYSIMPQRAGTD